MNITENSSAWRTPILTMSMEQFYEDNQESKRYPDKKVVVSEDRSRLFAVVGSKKKIVPHMDAVEMFYNGAQHAFNDRISMEVLSVKKGAGIRALLNFPDVDPINLGKTSYGEDDLCWLRAYLFNSYDGSTGNLRLKIGAFRTACDNSMVIGGKDFMLSSRDLSNLGDAEALGSRMKILYERSLKIADIWKAWRQITLTQNDAMAAFFDKLPKKFRDVLEDDSLFPRDLWTLYNDFTNIATHKTSTDNATISYDGKLENLFYGKTGPVYPLYKDVYEEIVQPATATPQEEETA